jgi:hypothetical protein
MSLRCTPSWRPSEPNNNRTLLKISVFEILICEPRARLLPQFCGHLADQRLGSFTFKEGPVRHNVHAALAPREHDIGSAPAGQESERFGADHRDDDDVVLITCFHELTINDLRVCCDGRNTDPERNRH